MKRILSLVLVLAANFILMSCHQEQHQYQEVNQEVKETWPDNNRVDKPANSVSTLLKRCEKDLKIAEAQLEETKYKMPKCRNASGAVQDVRNFRKLELKTGTYFLSDFKQNWQIAMKRCEYEGMKLVSIETKEENDAILEALPINSAVFTSGTDLGSEGDFYWFSTKEPFGFKHWDGVEPNDAVHEGVQNCVFIVNQSKFPRYGSWYDGQCEQAKHVFLCELNTC